MNNRLLVPVLLLLMATAIVIHVTLNVTGGALQQTETSSDTQQRNPPIVAPYAMRDWRTGEPSGLNLSIFVYRDRNRNGDYDLGDLPMPGVQVSLVRPQGEPRWESTNIGGYSNFRMRNRPGGDGIDRPDAFFHFSVDVPPGWQVTSGNTRQSTRFQSLPGSPAGLVAESPPDTVGLAPHLTLTGTVAKPGALRSLTLTTPAGKSQPVTVDAAGRFIVDTYPGEWRLHAVMENRAEPLQRQVTVDDVPVVVSTLETIAEVPPAKQHTVIETFDALPYAAIEKLPRGRNGLDWDYLLAVDNQTYGGPGYVNGMRSPPGVGYNSSGHPVTISGLQPGDRFDFDGGYFSAAWPESEGEILNIQGWRGAESVYQDQVHLSYLGPVWLAADYRDIDRLTLSTAHYWQFVADDLAFRLPEPRPQRAVRAAPDAAWLSQYDIFPGDRLAGDVMCAPTAAAIGLTQLGVSAASREATARLARRLAAEDYLGTRRDTGTAPQQMRDGLLRYASDNPLRVDVLDYVGWRPVASVSARRPSPYPDTGWLAAALDNDAVVLLNLGTYARQADGSLTRVGGHWINLRDVDGDTLLVHDPAPEHVDPEGQRLRLQRTRLNPDMTGARFAQGDIGIPLLDGLAVPEGADTWALDGALAMRITTDHEAATTP